MRIMPILLFCCILQVLISCSKEHYEKFDIISGGCGSIAFVDQIGSDFNTALDSLIAIRAAMIGVDYDVEEVPMEIEFHDDNRVFKGIKFIRASDHIMIFGMSDVLDSYGNYYMIIWCPD